MSTHITTSLSDKDKKRLYDRVKGWTTESEYIRQAVIQALDRDDAMDRATAKASQVQTKTAPLVNGKAPLVGATKRVLARTTPCPATTTRYH